MAAAKAKTRMDAARAAAARARIAAARKQQQAAAKAPVAKQPVAKKPAAVKRPTKGTAAELAARQRVARARAQADVKLVSERLARIRKDFYDIGQALARLKQPGGYGSLGYASFEAMLEAELEMSRSTADRLTLIAEHVSRELAERVGSSHAYALVRLMRATPEDDTVEELSTRTLTLPSGEQLHLPTASAREKAAAVAAVRQASRGSARRGKSTTAEERRMAQDIEASLRALGVARAKVQARATAPGKPADLRIEGVPMSQMALLCRALCGG